MPVNRKMMNSMREQYGKERGERVYYATENSQKHSKRHKLAESLAKRRRI